MSYKSYMIHLGCGVCYACGKSPAECQCPDDEIRPSRANPIVSGFFDTRTGKVIKLPRRVTRQRESRRLAPLKPDDDVLYPDQAAEYLKISRTTVDRMARDGTLPGVIPLRKGRRKSMYRVSRKLLEKFKDEGGGKK